MPPGLTELARAAGINEYKLKKGFKETFGNTVFGYLAETRLELAKNDLLEEEKSISEIAFELGYSSVHFLAIMRKRNLGYRRAGWEENKYRSSDFTLPLANFQLQLNYFYWQKKEYI